MTSNDQLPRNRVTGAFERRVAKALEGAGIASGVQVEGVGDDRTSVLVATSGGPDSTAALVAVARALGAERVTAAHFDHRLRPTAEVARERAVVDTVAGVLGVPLLAGRAPRRPTDTSEDAAREARYRWLATAARRAGATACITGHTQGDQAETVLLRLARGTAAGGAAGMFAVSRWPVVASGSRSLRLIRPLLGLSRAEVEAYLRALGVIAAQDPSNESLDYARNRVRLQAMPALREVNARAVEHLARFAAHQGEDDEELTRQAREWIAVHARITSAGAELDRTALRAAPPAIARRAVRLAANGIGVTLETAHVEAILHSARRNAAQVALPLARSETDGMILRLRLRPQRSAVD